MCRAFEIEKMSLLVSNQTIIIIGNLLMTSPSPPLDRQRFSNKEDETTTTTKKLLPFDDDEDVESRVRLLSSSRSKARYSVYVSFFTQLNKPLSCKRKRSRNDLELGTFDARKNRDPPHPREHLRRPKGKKTKTKTRKTKTTTTMSFKLVVVCVQNALEMRGDSIMTPFFKQQLCSVVVLFKRSRARREGGGGGGGVRRRRPGGRSCPSDVRLSSPERAGRAHNALEQSRSRQREREKDSYFFLPFFFLDWTVH